MARRAIKNSVENGTDDLVKTADDMMNEEGTDDAEDVEDEDHPTKSDKAEDEPPEDDKAAPEDAPEEEKAAPEDGVTERAEPVEERDGIPATEEKRSADANMSQGDAPAVAAGEDEDYQWEVSCCGVDIPLSK